jgi:tetratricopeptide (TPR) repeat protein
MVSDLNESHAEQHTHVQDVTLRALEENPELASAVDAGQVKRLKADAAKERGNDAFKAKDFEAALEDYTEAVKLDNTNATYYSNRHAAPTSIPLPALLWSCSCLGWSWCLKPTHTGASERSAV